MSVTKSIQLFLTFAVLVSSAFAQPLGNANRNPLRFPGRYPNALTPPVTAPVPATPVVEESSNDIKIADAAGTLKDPMSFIYLSKEYVFDVLVLASNFGVPGVDYKPELLPVSATSQQTSYEYQTGQEFQTGTTPQAQEDKSQWLKAISVSGNEEMEKLLELVADLSEWQRVARLPLQTTEKKRIDAAITGIYALAYNQMSAGMPNRNYTESSYNPQGQGVQPSPVDPQAMAEWYYYYQQLIAWERYVSEETLMLKSAENSGHYDLDTALGPQDLYLVPAAEGSPQTIHFDQKESQMTPYLSVVRPSAVKTSLDQMLRVMKDWAEERAKEDSEESRNFLVRLDGRQEKRFRYREWLNDQATEIRKMAEDYRRQLAGEQVEIEGMAILLTKEPVERIPFNARNIVTDHLTPYDLLDAEGKLIRPSEEGLEPLL